MQNSKCMLSKISDVWVSSKVTIIRRSYQTVHFLRENPTKTKKTKDISKDGALEPTRMPVASSLEISLVFLVFLGFLEEYAMFIPDFEFFVLFGFQLFDQA